MRRPAGNPLASRRVSTGPEGCQLHRPLTPSTHTRGPPRDSSGSPGGAAGPSRGSPGAPATQERPRSDTTADPASRRGETHSPQSPLPSTAAAPPLRTLQQAGRGSVRSARGRSRPRRFRGPPPEAQGGQQQPVSAKPRPSSSPAAL
ncbi:hypothetical protein NDU88_002018 [Pleurodeles waltl]|uniref:Uncharacterized protein n=1 Tax=Pleurodeles waltl TaxID=8319 RepID=A0AAV7VDK4_PLEWA|nr:hypothetical protein NDU88_002018 [Pleurodeles waltl]